MKTFYALIFSLFLVNSYAQVGISVKYNSNDFETWNTDFFQPNLLSEGRGFSSSYEVGFHYRYRLQKKHVDFLPEISYAKASTEQLALSADYSADFNLSNFNLAIPTQIYFLDFNNGCDCPTFSNQSDVIPKGLHVILSPALSIHQVNYTTLEFESETNEITNNFSNANLKLGVGIGLDLGINDHFTITPFAMYHVINTLSNDFINQFALDTFGQTGTTPTENASKLKQMQVGLRFSFQ